MRVKGSFVPSVIASGLLVACNSGHQSLPTSNYGEVVSSTKQNLSGSELFPLTMMPLGDSLIKSPLYVTMLNQGNYAESFGVMPNLNPDSGKAIYGFEIANKINTLSDFGYDVDSLESVSKADVATAYSIKYKTPGQNHDKDPAQIVRTASGLIILPKTQNIRGVVLYFHPTSFGKNQVPSCIFNSTTLPDYCKGAADPEDKTGFGMLSVLGSIYASRGFAVVAPDYVGMGADWNNVHPYVAYPEVNALSGFYMLPALRQILAENGVDKTTKLPLLLTGFSEGGAYALKASQMAQTNYARLLADNSLELKITSPQEGAYSLKDQMDFAFADSKDGILNCGNSTLSNYECGKSKMVDATANGLMINESVAKINNYSIVSSLGATKYKPVLTGYVLASAMNYSFHNLTPAYSFAMNDKFWSRIRIDGSTEELIGLFSGQATKYTADNITTSLVANTFSIDSYGKGIPNPLALYMEPYGIVGGVPAELSPIAGFGKNNQGTLFINEGVNTAPDFVKILTKGSTYNWQTKSPINFVHMKNDSAVTVINSHQAYSCMKYGKSFVGSDGLASSAGNCSTSASGNLIEATVINNAQLTNNVAALIPMSSTKLKGSALSRYWSAPKIRTLSGEVNLNVLVPDSAKAEVNSNLGLGIPFDHSDMFVLGNIVSLCTFENVLTNEINSGKCPNLIN